jgi:CheY-like chemotaxis protein
MEVAKEKDGWILIVDDDQVMRVILRTLLAKHFDVITAASGAEALAICRERLPQLVLMDIEMPDMDGVEACRQLRELSSVPIIFVTSHESLETHLKAYDVGGNDIIIKPINSEILLHKVRMQIRQYQDAHRLTEEKNSLQEMAMGFLSSMGHGGALLNFMRASVACRTHAELAQRLFETTRDMGIECSVLLRHNDGPTILTPHGDATPIEHSILEQAAEMGRIFQFRSRLAVNYPRVSIIVANMPDENLDPDAAGKIRDNIAILAETTEALCENVDMRQESMRRGEQLQIAHANAVEAVENLREKYALVLGDTRILIQEMVDKVERSYAWLGASATQERQLQDDLDETTKRILAMLMDGGDFEKQFEAMIVAMRSGGETKGVVELF